MRVVLLKDVSGIGRAGDIKEVADGYGRNFLLARGLAKAATPVTIADAETRKARESAEVRTRRQKLLDDAQKISGLEFRVEMRAGGGKKVFGSVTPLKIKEFLAKHGIIVEKGQVELKESIKEIGGHQVKIKLAPDNDASLKVIVQPIGGGQSK